MGNFKGQQYDVSPLPVKSSTAKLMEAVCPIVGVVWCYYTLHSLESCSCYFCLLPELASKQLQIGFGFGCFIAVVFLSCCVFLAGGDSSQDEAEDDVKQITVSPDFLFVIAQGTVHKKAC